MNSDNGSFNSMMDDSVLNNRTSDDSVSSLLAPLFATFEEALSRFVSRMICSSHAAELITVEILAVSATKLLAVRDSSSLGEKLGATTTLVYRTAIDKCLEWLREESGLGSFQTKTKGEVDEALGQLTPQSRAALLLCDQEGWSVEQCAEIFETSSSALRDDLMKARRTFRLHFGTLNGKSKNASIHERELAQIEDNYNQALKAADEERQRATERAQAEMHRRQVQELQDVMSTECDRSVQPGPLSAQNLSELATLDGVFLESFVCDEESLSAILVIPNNVSVHELSVDEILVLDEIIKKDMLLWPPPMAVDDFVNTFLSG